MYRVVASNNDTGSCTLELLPKLPILRHKRTSMNDQHKNSCATQHDNNHPNSTTSEMIKDIAPVHDSRLYIGQEIYRLHFSIIDKTRSWMRGTKRSIRWYVHIMVVYRIVSHDHR